MTKRAFSPYWHYALVGVIILLFAVIRFRLRDFPLERDEGEYAYMGQLMLQGIPPYKLAYNMKLPGTYAAYALILAVFGQTPDGIHCGLILINAATTLLVYFLGRRLFGSLAGVVACACYALLSTSSTVLGFAAHATHFVVLMALAGILLLLKAMEGKGGWLFFVSGILVGLAFIMKQPGIFFVLFAGSYLLYRDWRERPVDRKDLMLRSGLFWLGATAPFVITCLLLYTAGVFDKFWFWTFSYARAYGSQTDMGSGLLGFGNTFPRVVGPSMLIWIAAALGLTTLLWQPDSRSRAYFVLGFPAFSFLAVCPGLYFRPHYFILLLPAVALLAGLAVDSASRFLSKRGSSPGMAPALVLILGFAYSVYQQGQYLFELNPVQACRASYGTSPFPESLEIAKYIEDHTSKDARIVILGSEPQIYFYSRRHSATGYIYMYSLMEQHPYVLQMQQTMIDEIEKARPEYLIFVPQVTSWMAGPKSERLIVNWGNKYARSHYSLDGIADIRGTEETIYRWGQEARTYRPLSESTILIYKRND